MCLSGGQGAWPRAWSPVHITSASHTKECSRFKQEGVLRCLSPVICACALVGWWGQGQVTDCQVFLCPTQGSRRRDGAQRGWRRHYVD